MRITKALVTALIAIAATQAWARPPSQNNVGDLASDLQATRDVCANMAREAKEAYSYAQFKSGLDRDTARLQAEMDARVYGVGHGRRETVDYYAQRLQDVQEEQEATDRKATDDLSLAKGKVTQCLDDSRKKGKDLYVAFKKRHTNSSARLQTETLMAAWLTNIDEISTSAPDGGDTSLAAWKAERSRAEVTSL